MFIGRVITLLFCCILLIASKKKPETFLFKVEILAFDYGDREKSKEEYQFLEFDFNYPKERLADWDIYGDYAKLKSQMMDYPSLKFNLMKEKLEAINNKVLLHLTWKQKLSKYQSSKYLYISSDDYFNNEEYSIKNNIPRLEAFISIFLKRYLHIKLDLYLNSLENGLIKSYKLKKAARIINGKLYYLDHPKCGFLVRISKLK